MSESIYCRTCAGVSRLRQRPPATRVPLISRALTLAAIVVLIGLLPWLSGTDPALSLLRARSGEQEATAETLNAIRLSLGLDQGPWHALARWLGGLLHGDAGVSWVSGLPVLPGMLRATGVSLTLMASSALVALVLALLLCAGTMIRGLRGHTPRPAGFFAALLTALPEFLLASFLLITGAVWLQFFPPYGWLGWQYAVLPSLALGLPAGGYLGRLYSDALAGTFGESWLTTWSVLGISRRHTALAVIARSLPGVMPLTGLVLVSLTGGAIAVEKVFAIPGLGRATLGAAAAGDLPALQTGVLILLLLASLTGMLAGGGRRLLLGRALQLGAVPVPAQTAQPEKQRAWIPLLCLGILLIMVLAGLPRDPLTSEYLRLQPPSLALPFGADAMGRDLLARVAHGTLNTCLQALAVSLICLAAGLLMGAFPRAMTGPIEVTNALPPVIAGLVVAAVNGPTATGAAIAVTAVSWAPLAAHTAALVSEIQARPYMKMLPVVGVGAIRRTVFYVLPALCGPLLRHAMLRLPGIALALASLGFLGLGAPPPVPEWGRVLAEGMPYIERAWWSVLAPAAALAVLSVMAVTLSGLRWKKRATAH
ncbi:MULTISPECIES: ABC transporter permease subunit [Rahnella]|uniref:ABC transporter permease subunit n=1 Tax=Rahnella laticis TaxID=2787622 RepID=A0ABS0E0M0_9GAMM|nr:MULTISPECIES: ABC transporter permease subunit [Rahnella]MBF7978667.1 ABC transporter permease subunit [Rahnella laticis]MBF7998757.1 ABC transporter permease subunit [Rahnella sp. LAC-M12]